MLDTVSVGGAEDHVERRWRHLLAERIVDELERLDELTDELRPLPVGTVDEDPLEHRRLELEERLLDDLDELRRRVERADA